MIVKQIISRQPITLAQLSLILGELSKQRELCPEARRALEHAREFSKLDPSSSQELLEQLLKFDWIRPEIAVKLVDLIPLTKDELRAVFAKERFMPMESELDQLLDLILRYA